MNKIKVKTDKIKNHPDFLKAADEEPETPLNDYKQLKADKIDSTYAGKISSIKFICYGLLVIFVLLILSGFLNMYLKVKKMSQYKRILLFY